MKGAHAPFSLFIIYNWDLPILELRLLNPNLLVEYLLA